MQRFDTLANRLIGLLLCALILAQVISVTFFTGQQEGRERDTRESQFLRQAETASRVLDGMPPDARQPSVSAFNGQGFVFHVNAESAIAEGDTKAETQAVDAWRFPDTTRLRRSPDRRTWADRYLDLRPRPAAPESERPPPPPRRDPPPRRPPPGEGLGGFDRRPPPPPPPPEGAPPPHEGGPGGPVALEIAIPLSSGEWLNGELFWPNRAPPWMLPLIVQALLTALGLTIVVVVLVRHNTRGLRGLAAAAHRVGRGEDVDALSARGPSEIRDAITAFNTMTERLRRLIQGRTRLLAAISHDLRTPITSLRIRAEMVEDVENRERMLATLDEMQSLAEGSLTLAREDAAAEPTAPTDLAALVQSVCDDLSDMDLPVTVVTPARFTYPCRVNSLKRAIRNLVENAIKYGQKADVSLITTASQIIVQVDDQGPGIPPAQMERMFQPFVRLEESRSKETGGFGLGLTIARSIAHAHGGDVVLTNRSEGGLRARIILPQITGEKLL